LASNFQYKFFGLNINSDVCLQLIGETSFDIKPDLEIKYDPSIKLKNDKRVFICNLNKIILNYPKIGAINIDRNGELLTYNYKDLNLNFLSKIINHGLGYSYYQRRKLALHGSAVKVNKFAALFMGESGSGKSSTVAALNKEFQVLSDDTVGFSFNDREASLYPGLNYFKIDPEMEKEISISNEKIEINDDRGRNFYKSINQNHKTIPVKSCYILRWGNDQTIKEINNPKDKIAAFLQSAYTCFPLNTCIESASILIKYSSFFFKNVKMYYFIRKKGNILANTDLVSKHLKDNNEKY
jgi:energy-coupling factor transporter ATP-binding protein EcfA2